VASLPDLEYAAQNAIEECRPNSIKHLKPVIRAARVELEAKAYDVGALDDIVRRKLEKGSF
jgi:hypothetical protein